MTIKDRVRQLCINKGITLKDAEDEIGVARGYLSKLDKFKPNAAKLQLIADYFGVSADYILTGEEGNRKPHYMVTETAQMAQQIFDNKELRMLFSTVKDAQPEDIKFVHDMFLALKKRENNGIYSSN